LPRQAPKACTRSLTSSCMTLASFRASLRCFSPSPSSSTFTAAFAMEGWRGPRQAGLGVLLVRRTGGKPMRVCAVRARARAPGYPGLRGGGWAAATPGASAAQGSTHLLYDDGSPCVVSLAGPPAAQEGLAAAAAAQALLDGVPAATKQARRRARTAAWRRGGLFHHGRSVVAVWLESSIKWPSALFAVCAGPDSRRTGLLGGAPVSLGSCVVCGAAPARL
jgi:hypothetical protein